jgi:hypothetical protein
MQFETSPIFKKLKKIIQQIPEQHIGKAPNQETTDNSHTEHCTHTTGSTNVKVQ